MMDWSKPGKGGVACTQQVGQEQGGRMHGGVLREEGKGSEGRQWVTSHSAAPLHTYVYCTLVHT